MQSRIRNLLPLGLFLLLSIVLQQEAHADLGKIRCLPTLPPLCSIKIFPSEEVEAEEESKVAHGLLDGYDVVFISPEDVCDFAPGNPELESCPTADHFDPILIGELYFS